MLSLISPILADKAKFFLPQIKQIFADNEKVNINQRKSVISAGSIILQIKRSHYQIDKKCSF